MKRILGCCVAALGVAMSFPAAAQQVDPAMQAVIYQLQQCRQSSDETARAAFTQLAAEKKRADDAEAKLKAAEKPVESK